MIEQVLRQFQRGEQAIWGERQSALTCGGPDGWTSHQVQNISLVAKPKAVALHIREVSLRGRHDDNDQVSPDVEVGWVCSAQHVVRFGLDVVLKGAVGSKDGVLCGLYGNFYCLCRPRKVMPSGVLDEEVNANRFGFELTDSETCGTRECAHVLLSKVTLYAAVVSLKLLN